jgi:AcrR family transcriptional regulator
MQGKVAARRPRRRGTRQATRERLIRSALQLLQRGGESAVNTVSVTRGAGVAQSAFYLHFGGVEDCLAVAARRVTGEIRAAVAAGRRRMFEAGGSAEDLRRSYRNMFDLVERQRPILQLFLRYRSDPRALGGTIHRFARGLVADLADQLAQQAALESLPRRWIEALAESLVAASTAAIEAHLGGRGPSVEEWCRLLAAFSQGASEAVVGSAPSRRNGR